MNMVVAKSLGFLRSFDRRLWMLALGWFVAAFGFAASMPFVSVYFYRVLGLSLAQIAYFFLVMALLRAVFQAVGGELSDRMGRMSLLVSSQFLRALSFFALALAIYYEAGFWWVGGLLLLNAIFGSVFFPVLNALVSDILPGRQRLDGYAITRSAGNLGWALGPAVGGFIAANSYAVVFHLSAVMALASGMIFAFFLKVPAVSGAKERFHLSDLGEIRTNRYLAWHVGLTFLVYLVHLQLVVPLALYTTEITGALDEAGLGRLYLINGLIIVLVQVPVTRLLSRYRFTTQLAVGSMLYFVGYGVIGMHATFAYFAMVITIVSLGEMFVSPPSLTLISRFAPEGRIGRYMGIHGFFVTLGFSLAPLYGNALLDAFPGNTTVAWILIASAAGLAGLGYVFFGRILPIGLNHEAS